MKRMSSSNLQVCMLTTFWKLLLFLRPWGNYVFIVSLKCPLLTVSAALTWFLLLWNHPDPAAIKLPPHFVQGNLDYFCLCNHHPQCGSLSSFVPCLLSSAALSSTGRFPMGTSVNSISPNKLEQIFCFLLFEDVTDTLKCRFLHLYFLIFE